MPQVIDQPERLSQASATLAASGPATAAARPIRRLGLTLGGGGFRGSAHIGVLYELERLGLTFDVVSGTSVGAIIGAGVASGMSAQRLDRAFRQLSPRGLLSRDRERWGLIGTSKLRQALDAFFGPLRIEDLAIPFAAVVVDLVTGRQVVLDRGPLVDALLASAAMPGVFPPLRRGPAALVDGGLCNNVPVDVARQLGAERVIAVNLIAREPFCLADWEPTRRFALAHWLPIRPLALAERAFIVLLHELTRHTLRAAPPDLLLTPQVNALSTGTFLSADAGLAAGRAAAASYAHALAALRRWRMGDPPPAI